MCFVIIANGWEPLTIITKHSILDVATALDPPLKSNHFLLGDYLYYARKNQITLSIQRQ